MDRLKNLIALFGNRTHYPGICTPMLYRLSYQGNLMIQSVQIAISNLILPPPSLANLCQRPTSQPTSNSQMIEESRHLSGRY